MHFGPLTHTQMLSFKGLSIRLALDRVSVLGVPQMSGAVIPPYLGLARFVTPELLAMIGLYFGWSWLR